MKLNYLLAVLPLAVPSMAAPSPEADSPPNLEARKVAKNDLGRVTFTQCGQTDTKATKNGAVTSGSMWYMATYETTCKDGYKVTVTADQSCTHGIKEWFENAISYNLKKFDTDSGPGKGKFTGNIDIVSSKPGGKVSFDGGKKEIPLGKATNADDKTPKHDHAKCKSACGKSSSVDGDGEVSIWENVKDIPKDFLCDGHGGAADSN